MNKDKISNETETSGGRRKENRGNRKYQLYSVYCTLWKCLLVPMRGAFLERAGNFGIGARWNMGIKKAWCVMGPLHRKGFVRPLGAFGVDSPYAPLLRRLAPHRTRVRARLADHLYRRPPHTSRCPLLFSRFRFRQCRRRRGRSTLLGTLVVSNKCEELVNVRIGNRGVSSRRLFQGATVDRDHVTAALRRVRRTRRHY